MDKIIKFIVSILRCCTKALNYLSAKAGAWSLVIVPLFFCFIYFLFKTQLAFYITLIFTVASFTYLLIKVIIMSISLLRSVNNLDYFKVGNNKEDSSRRLKLLENILGILMGLCFLAVFFINSQVLNSIFTITIMYLIIFVFVLYGIIKFNNIFATSMFIFSSTIPGFLVCLYAITFLVSILVILMNLLNFGNIGNVEVFKSIDSKSLTLFALMMPKYYPIILFNIIISLFFQLLIIFVRPVYHLSKTKISLRILSVIFTIATISLMLFASDIKDMLLHVINNNKFDPVQIKEINQYLGSDFNKAITDSFIQRLVTIVFLPYTIGALVCLLIIDLKENKYKKKAKKYYFKAISNHYKNHTENVVKYLKKSIYFGDTFEINIYNTSEFREYLNILGYNNLDEHNMPRKSFRGTMKKHISDVKQRFGL